MCYILCWYLTTKLFNRFHINSYYVKTSKSLDILCWQLYITLCKIAIVYCQIWKRSVTINKISLLLHFTEKLFLLNQVDIYVTTYTPYRTVRAVFSHTALHSIDFIIYRKYWPLFWVMVICIFQASY